MHIRDNRRRAPDRLGMSVDRFARTDPTEAMMIDDLDDLRLLDALNSLIALVVIDKNHLCRVGDTQSVTAHETNDASIL